MDRTSFQLNPPSLITSPGRCYKACADYKVSKSKKKFISVYKLVNQGKNTGCQCKVNVNVAVAGYSYPI